MKDKICLALDVPTLSAARELVSKTRDFVGVYKVGLELFVAEGPSIIQALRSNGCQVFLDLKLHDIPTTMVRAMKRIAELGVSFTTIHAAAGAEAMEACAATAVSGGVRVLAVTVLTSERRSRGTGARIEARVREAAGVGVHGFICSPIDIRHVRAGAKRAFVVTPGVRPKGTPTHDQRRVLSPAEAVEAGSDMLVIGRPIRDSYDPREAAKAIYESIGGT